MLCSIFEVTHTVVYLTLLRVSHPFREEMKMDAVASTIQEHIVYRIGISKVSLPGFSSADVGHVFIPRSHSYLL